MPNSDKNSNSHDLFLKSLHKYRLLLPVLAPLLFVLFLELILSFEEVKLFSETKDNQTLMNIQQCRSGDGDVDSFCQFFPKNPLDYQNLSLLKEI